MYFGIVSRSASGLVQDYIPPNGLAFSCRERATTSLQKADDLAREAVSCNAGLGRPVCANRLTRPIIVVLELALGGGPKPLVEPRSAASVADNQTPHTVNQSHKMLLRSVAFEAVVLPHTIVYGRYRSLAIHQVGVAFASPDPMA